jgi:hypothetical protein
MAGGGSTGSSASGRRISSLRQSLDPLLVPELVFAAVVALIAIYLAKSASRGGKSLRRAWLMTAGVTTLGLAVANVRVGDQAVEMLVLDLLLAVPVTGLMAATVAALQRSGRGVIVRVLGAFLAGVAMTLFMGKLVTV